jgi:hypothetical protein
MLLDTHTFLWFLNEDANLPPVLKQQIENADAIFVSIVSVWEVVSVQPLDAYRLHLRFEDGIEGVIDVSEIIPFSGIFSPLADLNYFATVQVNSEFGTIVWDNGADLDPDVLYSIVANQPIPDYSREITGVAIFLPLPITVKFRNGSRAHADSSIAP